MKQFIVYLHWTITSKVLRHYLKCLTLSQNSLRKTSKNLLNCSTTFSNLKTSKVELKECVHKSWSTMLKNTQLFTEKRSKYFQLWLKWSSIIWLTSMIKSPQNGWNQLRDIMKIWRMMKTFKPLGLVWVLSTDLSTQSEKNKSCLFCHKLFKNYFFKMIGDTNTLPLWLFLKLDNIWKRQTKFNLF